MPLTTGTSVRINGKKHTVIDDAFAKDAQNIKTTLKQLEQLTKSNAPGSQLATSLTQALHGFLSTSTKKDPVSGRDTPNVLNGMPKKLDDAVKTALINVFTAAFKQDLPAIPAGSQLQKLLRQLGQQVFSQMGKGEKTQLDTILTDLITQYEKQSANKTQTQAKTGLADNESSAINAVISPDGKTIPTGHYPTNDFLAGLLKLASPDGQTVKPVTTAQASKLASDIGQKYTNGRFSEFAALDSKNEDAVNKALSYLLKNTPEADADKIEKMAKPIFGIHQ